MAVDQQYIDEACRDLGVSEVSGLRDGSQKTVRLVNSQATGEQLVLKVIQLGPSSPDALQRAAREVELLRSISSPHVVAARSDLLEVRSPPVAAAWLEEYLVGDDLADLVGSAWPWTDTADMGAQVALGAGALHDLRVTHRDLSARNVRRTTSGYKVMDPGYARHELLPPITVGGHPGTYGFMSPEHLRPPPAGPTRLSDVFAIGVLMYLALTEDVPIPFAGDVADYYNRLRVGAHVPLGSLRPDLDAAAIKLVERCLDRQPARRFSHGRDLAASLAALA